MKAPILITFEWEVCAQKTQLFGESLPKNAQKRLFGLFFQKFARVVEKKANSNVNSVNF